MTIKLRTLSSSFLTILLILPLQAVSADPTLTMNAPFYLWWEQFVILPPRADDLELSTGGTATALLFNPNATSANPDPIRQRNWPYTAGGAYMDKNGVIYVDDLFNTPGQPPNTKTPVMRVIGGQVVDY